jgi:signal peptidase I
VNTGGTSPVEVDHSVGLAARADVLVQAGNPPESSAGVADVLRVVASVFSAFANSSLIMLLAWILLPAAVLGWKPTAVSSGSMEPAIERGDVVLMRPPSLESPLTPDTVIRFPDNKSGGSIVHRIVSVDEEVATYITKGDANEATDTTPIPFGEVDGVGTMLVPIIGHPILWYTEGRFVPLGALAVGLTSVLIGGMAGSRSDEPEPLSSTWSDPITAQTIGDIGAPQLPLFGSAASGRWNLTNRGSP